MKAGWQTLPFEDCIESVVYTTKVQRKDFLADGAYPVISQEEAFINGYWDKETDLFRVDRPVIIFGDHTRALKYVDFDFILGADGVKVLKPKPFLHPRFFYYQLHTAKLESLGYARHYRLLKECRITYPAFAEQQRIVAILDEAFAAIATAKANTEKNLNNARAVFESYLQEVFSCRDGDWKSLPFEDCIENATYTTKIRRKDFLEIGKFPVVSQEMELINGYWNDINDVFLVNTPIVIFGDHTRVLKYIDFDFVLGADGVKLLCPKDFIVSKFFYYQLQTARLESLGYARHYKLLKELRIKFPGISKQNEIIIKLDSVREQTQVLESLYQRKIAALDELKKSLLHQAFTSQLTAKAADRQLGTAL